MKGKIILSTIVMIFNCYLFSQIDNSDKKHLKFTEKVSKLYATGNYYKLYKTSNKALLSFPNDSWFKYMFSYALYNSQGNKKIIKQYGDVDFLMLVMEQLEENEPIQKEADFSFSDDLQNELYNRSIEKWELNEFNNSLPYLQTLFNYFNNSEPNYENYYWEDIQDDLFQLAKSMYLTNELESKKIFDWILNTFDKSNFKLKYNGTDGFSDKEYYFEEFKNPVYCLANTAENENYFSVAEKELIYLQNIVRINPSLFEKTFLKKYLEEFPSKKASKYTISLIDDLQNQKKLQLLFPTKKIFLAAEYHANDMGKSGSIGHVSSNGTTFSDRLNNFGVTGYIGENCSYGDSNPLNSLIRLLIDQGIESLGHRRNILNGNFSSIGVAIRSHKTYGNNTVLDYSN